MKNSKLIVIFSLLVQLIFAQQNARITSFFNDSLKGKWILQQYCVLEARDCDTINKGKEYIIFSKIGPTNFVNYESNFNQIVKDSAKLYLPSNTYFGLGWTMDNFLFNGFGNYEKQIIGFQSIDEMAIEEDSFIGRVKFYKRDKNYVSGLIFANSQDNYGISVYPNPFKEFINISFNIPFSLYDLSLNLYSTTGLLIKKFKIAERGQFTKAILLRDLKKGVYLGIVTFNNKGVNIIKLIKE